MDALGNLLDDDSAAKQGTIWSTQDPGAEDQVILPCVTAKHTLKLRLMLVVPEAIWFTIIESFHLPIIGASLCALH